MNREPSTRSARTETFGMRFTPEEMSALTQAADEAGETVVDYIRKAIAQRQQGNPALPAVNVFVGIASMQVDYHLGTWGDAPHSVTPPDFPKHLSNLHLTPDNITR